MKRSLHFFNDEVIQVNLHEESIKVEFFSSEELNWKIINDKNLIEILNEKEIEDCFDINSYLKNIDFMFDKMK